MQTGAWSVAVFKGSCILRNIEMSKYNTQDDKKLLYVLYLLQRCANSFTEKNVHKNLKQRIVNSMCASFYQTKNLVLCRTVPRKFVKQYLYHSE